MHALQNREYGIGWGHRDQEYRRTTVTVHSIDGDNVCFCIKGLKAYKNGYYVELSESVATTNATCLDDWLLKHPEDAKE